MITQAKLEDMPAIMEIIRLTVEEMKSYHNTQWDENYPKSEDFIKDIEQGDLYVEKQDGYLRGFICINQIQAVEYKALNWQLEEPCMVIHRMAVNPLCRNSGVGSKLMCFAEELVLQNQMRYLKTDTYSINTKMNALFKKFGYQFVGEVNFGDKEKAFYCYEKQLGEVN